MVRAIVVCLFAVVVGAADVAQSSQPVVRQQPPPGMPAKSELSTMVKRAARGTNGRAMVGVTDGRSIRTAASSGSTQTPFRMWSVSKVPTAIALLEAHGGRPLGADTTRAMRRALVGSGDCAQRQMVVELQHLRGGPHTAHADFLQVLRSGGATRAQMPDRQSPASGGCRDYLLQRSTTPDPLRSAMQFGVATWTLGDATRFAHSLRHAPPHIRSLLRATKTNPDDPFASREDITEDPTWGAGVALKDLRPAYKAGWGGSSGETRTFLLEQVIAVGRYGIVVTFEPPDRPPRDDPGLTAAPRVFERLLSDLRKRLAL